MPLPTHCIYRSDQPTSAYDFAPDMPAAIAYAARMTAETGQAYSAATLDDFCAASTRYWIASNPLHEISESEWNEMHEILPPLYRPGALGFFMSEFTSGTVTNQYVRHNGKFYCGAVDILNRETWITAEQCDACKLQTWRVSGTDRTQGAIGAMQPFSACVIASDKDDAWQKARALQESNGRGQDFLATQAECLP